MLHMLNIANDSATHILVNRPIEISASHYDSSANWLLEIEPIIELLKSSKYVVLLKMNQIIMRYMCGYGGMLICRTLLLIDRLIGVGRE